MGKFMDLLKNFLPIDEDKVKIVNIRKEFKNKFKIDPDDIEEFRTRNGIVYITHIFEAPHYAKVFVLINGENTEEVNELVSAYIARLTFLVQHHIYYEALIETI